MVAPLETVTLTSGDALVIVDVQNDFLPGGALAVGGGDQIVPILNRYIDLALAAGLPVVASRDWHPVDHCSFASQGGPWPAHCVAGTGGAAFASNLALPAATWVVAKATTAAADAYSAFEGTTLHQSLQQAGVRRVLVGGLATDYCVLNTVRDALALGYGVLVLLDAIRAVNVNPDDGVNALAEMVRLGARMTTVEHCQ